MGEFFIIPSISPQLVLGYPWLKTHNPTINWAENRFKKLSEFCLQNCLRTAISHSAKQPKHPEPVDVSKVPPEYHSLMPVFSKQKTLCLPLHPPYGCPFGLLPGPHDLSVHSTTSGPEKEVTREYIKDSLAHVGA